MEIEWDPGVRADQVAKVDKDLLVLALDPIQTTYLEQMLIL